jgi:NhaA family Na+:H+ antiporter
MSAAQRIHTFEVRVSLVIQKFLAHEAHSGIFLFLATIAAMVWANSPWSQSYFDLWHTPLGFEFGSHIADLTLGHWINDALMVLFFLLMGLEIKREFLVGELSSMRKAAFPVVAAVGGMLLPGVIYVLINLQPGGHPGGFGIPMETDAAFALGFLLLLGKRVPMALKVFITSFAVFDDLGGVLLVGLVYAGDLNMNMLLYALIPIATLVLLNVLKVKRLWPYLAAGIVLWFFVEQSGIHATVAGIILAMAIPVRARISPAQVVQICHTELADIHAEEETRKNMLLTTEQQDSLEDMAEAYEAVQNPLVRLEHTLHPITAYLVIPLFALANAGVAIGGAEISLLAPTSLGIMLALALGKPLGIVGATYLASLLGWIHQPDSLSWRHIIGAGILGGIGFTMSIFITHLAITDAAQEASAKLAIVLVSFLMGILGTVFLLWNSKKEPVEMAAEAE